MTIKIKVRAHEIKNKRTLKVMPISKFTAKMKEEITKIHQPNNVLIHMRYVTILIILWHNTMVNE